MEKATFVGKLRAMMRIDIITVLPELLQSPLNYSILKRAQDKKLVGINIGESTTIHSGERPVWSCR